ncbi:MAG: hypothetical protein HYW65_01475 [Candidatus Liptonbacteria bacterium]|nr:hypothetical protein [Candidatus Liptonbacteria bacterium]
MSKTILIIVGVVAAIVLIVFGLGAGRQTTPPQITRVSTSTADDAAGKGEMVERGEKEEVGERGEIGEKAKIPVPAAVTVIYTDAGFSPATVTVKKGGTVTFKNNSSRAFWPASGPHPEHTGYPEKGTCGGSAFDSCTAVAAGGEWSLTFNQIGTWRYHDHLNSVKRGTIVVE